MSNPSRIPSDPGQEDPDTVAREVSGQNAYGLYAGMGLTFAATIIAFGWVGWWLDGKLGSRPLLMIVGVLAGSAGGLISMVKRVGGARSRETKAKSDFADGSDDH